MALNLSRVRKSSSDLRKPYVPSSEFQRMSRRMHVEIVYQYELMKIPYVLEKKTMILAVLLTQLFIEGIITVD